MAWSRLVGPSLQLDIVVEQTHLLTWLEGRQADVGTAIASEGVTQCAVSAAANLSLDGEVDLGEIVSSQLHCVEGVVSSGPFCSVFGFELLLHAASAVFARAASLSGLGSALGR